MAGIVRKPLMRFKGSKRNKKRLKEPRCGMTFFTLSVMRTELRGNKREKTKRTNQTDENFV